MNYGAHNVVCEQKTTQAGNTIEQTITSFVFNKLSYGVGIITSLFNIPQVLTVWVGKNTEGVSLISWLGFSLGSVFWLAYARYNKEKALVFTFSLTLLLQIFIVIGVILY